MLFHIRVWEHKLLADDTDEFMIGGDKAAQCSHGGTVGIKLCDGHAVLVVRFAEVRDALIQFADDGRINRV